MAKSTGLHCKHVTTLPLFQTTILESRDACEIKLTKPLKFVTGRIDCNNIDEELDCITDANKEEYGLSDAGFVTCKAEVNTFPSIENSILILY